MVLGYSFLEMFSNVSTIRFDVCYCFIHFYYLSKYPHLHSTLLLLVYLQLGVFLL
jgi:hypothetical protein